LTDLRDYQAQAVEEIEDVPSALSIAERRLAPSTLAERKRAA